MRSLFLLGFPRSGAGVLARGLRSAGYDLGPDVPPPGSRSAADAAVPRALAAASEAVLARAGAPVALRHGWRWHAELDAGVRLASEPADLALFEPLVARRPFCLWDPRLVWTVPIARRLAPDAGLVCVFRHPLESAAALIEASRRDPVLAKSAPDQASLVAAWTLAHRRILDHLAHDGDWLFVHRDELVRGDATARIAAFAGAPFDAGRLVPELLRAAAADVPAESAEVWTELCARAGYRAESRVHVPAASAPAEIAAVVPVREGEQPAARATLDALLAQRNVRAEVFAIDHTLAQDFAQDGVRVLRQRAPSRGRAYRAVLEASDAPWIAWSEPGSRALPHRLARSLCAAAERPDVDFWTSGVSLAATERSFARSEPSSANGASDGWTATALVRRARLAAIDARDFAPAELALLERARGEGRWAHLDEALVELEPEHHALLAARARHDEELLALARGLRCSEPELTVLLALHDRQDVIVDCLEGFARQLVPPGALEIVVVDDGSSDASPELVAALDPLVPITLLRQASAGAAAARNRGLAHVRGRHVLFVNDDTIPFPDTARRHLAAHRELADPRAIVLGTFEQPAAELDNALVRLLERTTHVFGYAAHEPGAVIGGAHFYTCNVSLRSAALREVGGFDESLPCYGEDTELGLRLERAGYRIHYRPDARAVHRHVPRFESLRWRQRRVASSHVRLFARHPGATFGPLAGVTRDEIAALVRSVAPHAERIERAGRSLAGVDLAAVAGAGDGFAACARQMDEALEELVGRLDRYWWRLGIDDGLAELGLSGFPELLAERPLELVGVERPCALVIGDEKGRWVRAALDWLASGPDSPRLVVAHEPATDVTRGAGLLTTRAAERGLAVQLYRTFLGAAAPAARLLGAASVWIPTSADAPALRDAAVRAGIAVFDAASAPPAPPPPSVDRSTIDPTTPALRHVTAREPSHV